MDRSRRKQDCKSGRFQPRHFFAQQRQPIGETMVVHSLYHGVRHAVEWLKRELPIASRPSVGRKQLGQGYLDRFVDCLYVPEAHASVESHSITVLGRHFKVNF